MARARRKPEEAEGGSERWLATYADMVTLLMAFFVMLYAMSTVDVQKWAALVSGLSAPFGNESGEGLMPESSGLLPDGSGTDPTMHGAVAAATETAVDRADPRQQQLDDISDALEQALHEEGLDGIVEQRREERGLVVSVATDDVLFDLGSTAIDRRGRAIIGAVAQVLGEFPNEVMIEGFTDDLPLRRGSYDNWNLSTDRAVAVLRVMVADHGLPPEAVGAVGYGEFRPIVPNSSQENRAKNRRVDIVVLLAQEASA